MAKKLRRILRRIKIRWMRSDRAWGYAEAEKWTIHLDDRMDDKTLIEIATHETGHVVLPMVDESAIDLLGKQVADVLTRLGFSRNHEGVR